MLQKFKTWLRGPKEELLLADTSTDDTSLIQADPSRPIRFGVIVLLASLAGFTIWATTAPLDEGVPSPGMVTFDSKRQTVQHLTGGMVAEVLVKEGESVADGQVLIQMRDGQARANHDATLHSYYSLAATQARLIAEQSGLQSVVFGADLANDQHPLAKQHRAAQMALFQARRAALAGDLAIYAESASSADIVAQSAEAQLKIITQQLAGMRDLVTEGFAPRNQQLDLERQTLDLASSARRSRSQAAEMRLRAAQRINEGRREVETQLADVTREVELAKQRLQVTAEDLERTVLKSPSQGQVVGLLTQMPGAVIGPGQRLMEIVPKDEALVLEVHISPHLIDNVHVGLPADINFSTFANHPQLRVDGKVISVAGDLLSDQGPGGMTNSYYLARIAVTPEGMKSLGNNRLQPGMPADVVIKTGERTFIAYLMKPLLHRLQSSLKEA